MKILIIYYSKTGHTEKVALDLTKRFNCTLEKIIDKKNRQGIWGYLLGGRDAMKKRQTEIGQPTNNPENYDLIIIGMPVWGWNLVPAIRTYLTENQSKIKKYAFFVTSENTEVDKLIPCFQEVVMNEPAASVGFSAVELKNNNIYTNKLEKFIEKINNN